MTSHHSTAKVPTSLASTSGFHGAGGPSSECNCDIAPECVEIEVRFLLAWGSKACLVIIPN